MMFRIVVAGRLSDGFAAGLPGVGQRDVGRNTVLEGEFVDQSHLHGLLDRLRGLGLEVTNFFTFRSDVGPELLPNSSTDEKDAPHDG